MLLYFIYSIYFGLLAAQASLPGHPLLATAVVGSAAGSCRMDVILLLWFWWGFPAAFLKKALFLSLSNVCVFVLQKICFIALYKCKYKVHLY